MALARITASSGPPLATAPPPAPGRQLTEAVDDFQRVLTIDQRTALYQLKSVPDADAVLVFTAELDYSCQDRKGRSIATRLHTVLQSMREFSAVIDTFISSNPELAALVWGSIKLTMQIALNFTSYYESLSSLFMSFAASCPRFAEYQALYPNSVELQAALCNFHAAVIRCCKHAVEVTQRPWQSQLLNSFWQSFEQEFRPDISQIQRCGNEVKEEIALAKARADHQEQELRKKESEAASGQRWKLRDMLSRAGGELETIKEWQLQQNKRRSRDTRQRLLESLSSHDCLTPFKAACKSRHCNTAQWLFQSETFCRWREGVASPWLWCSGKIGSGKTILIASAVSYMFAHKDGASETVTFFFPQFDDPRSLSAETVIRSVIRQSLDSTTLSKELEASLVALNQKPFTELNDLKPLLSKRIDQSRAFYIFIDALDEFEPDERRALLNMLASVASEQPQLRIFVAGRESLGSELKSKVSQIGRVSMASAEANADISVYIEEAIQQRIQNQELVVGDHALVSDIKEALCRHADGMFLWVTFLIDELCAQSCDDDIRQALECLPANLTETFNRALLRIVSRRKASVAAKAFSWIATAKRHLTLQELREAISIQVGQPHSMPQRLVNGIDQLASWCENLIHVDEELKTVKFAHQAIYKFIVEGVGGSQGSNPFYLDMSEADHHAGEICVTYLCFNDFKTTLARRTQPMSSVRPVAMAKLAVSHQVKLPNTILALRTKSKRNGDKKDLDVVGLLASYGQEKADESQKKLQQSHPFLEYASVHWISHTGRFREGSSVTYGLWHQIVTGGHELAKSPFDGQQAFDVSDSRLLDWSMESHHSALLLLLGKWGKISQQKKETLMQISAAEGITDLLDVLLDNPSDRLIQEGMKTALRKGHLAITERLFAAAADVGVEISAAVVATAIEVGRVAIADRFLATGAAAESDDAAGQSPLEAASLSGNLVMVERLLARGAGVHPVCVNNAVVAASRDGHLPVVGRLLELKVHPSTASLSIALGAASKHGNLALVERLLEVGAKADGNKNLTPLGEASGAGHLDVVERLLAAGAEVNPQSRITPLQAACNSGHFDVVLRLGAAGASTKARADKQPWRCQVVTPQLVKPHMRTGGGGMDPRERYFEPEAGK